MIDLGNFKLKIKKGFEALVGFYKNNQMKTLFTLGVVTILLGAVFFYSLFFIPVKDFPGQKMVEVQEGDTLYRVSSKMEEAGIIKSAFWLRSAVIAMQGEANVFAGDYYFNEPESLLEVARRVTEGEYGLEPVRVTVPEGLNIFEIAEILEGVLVRFDPEEFLSEAEEGYLFPDTYFFRPNAGAREVVRAMRSNFDERTREIREEAKERGWDFDEIVNMASILETEARTTEARRKIADILYRRLDINMPLQVDVTFKYINGKNTYQLTRDDLQIDSPYNTYVYTGLPPTPIANPGVDSILAALDPIETNYLYFLSDRSGNMYYAEDFEGHIANRRFMDN